MTGVSHTEEWKKQPDDWRCPCCFRLKQDCELTKGDGSKLGWLVWHHDHMADYPKHVIQVSFGGHKGFCANSPLRREALIFKDNLELMARRFRDVLVCLDCNETEGTIKTRIQADKYFTFHIHEIRKAFIPKPNSKHLLVEEHMPFYSHLYISNKERLVAGRKRMIEQAIHSAHHEGIFWGSAIDFNRHFTDDDLIVKYPTFDSGDRIANALIKGEPALQGFEWPMSHDERLTNMYQAGNSFSEIARALGRTSYAVELRLKKLGLRR
jgi:hypothetical protein